MNLRKTVAASFLVLVSAAGCTHVSMAPPPAEKPPAPAAPPPPTPEPAPTPAPEPAPAVTAPEPAPAPEPPKATLSDKSIDLATPIEFAEKKADILPTSEAVLNEVAAIFQAHPELKLVSIEAYSANDGVPMHLRVAVVGWCRDSS